MTDKKNHSTIYGADIFHSLSCVRSFDCPWAIRIFSSQLGLLVTAIRNEYSFCNLYFVARYCFLYRSEEK